MTTVDIEEAQSHLSELVEKAVRGEPFVIADGGKPLVKVSALESALPSGGKRTGFMAGNIKVPDDFDTMHADEIVKTFEGRK